MKNENQMGIFSRFLTVWVLLCMATGILIGNFFPKVVDNLASMEYAKISIPITILIWIIIFPMMLKVDFASIKSSLKCKKGLSVTTVVNWLIKPFTMYLIAYFFIKVVFNSLIPLDLQDEFINGMVILGAAPCTAMVFVWNKLSKGDVSFTVVQVAVNDLILLVLFAPIITILLGTSNVNIPYDTLILSVVLFVVIPLVFGILTRYIFTKKNMVSKLEELVTKFDGVTMVGLLLTLVIIFIFQGETIVDNPMYITLISIPLIVQTLFIFFVAYLWSKAMKVKYEIAAPSALIGASNFFELAVAVSIALFGLESGATLAVVVGIIVEVPLMLVLVKICNSTKHWFN